MPGICSLGVLSMSWNL